jgi:hypothetical protein
MAMPREVLAIPRNFGLEGVGLRSDGAVPDATVLRFTLSETFTGADFAIRSGGVVRLAPQLARWMCHYRPLPGEVIMV